MGSHDVIEDFRLENGLECFLGPDCTTQIVSYATIILEFLMPIFEAILGKMGYTSNQISEKTYEDVLCSKIRFSHKFSVVWFSTYNLVISLKGIKESRLQSSHLVSL